MILINADTPRWIRELDRFIHLKSLLLVHGNVLDLASCQIENDGGHRYWVEDRMDRFFSRLLTGMGYAVVGQFNPVEGLNFADESMEKTFTELSGEKLPTQRGGTGLVNAGPLTRQIATVLSNRQTPCAFVYHFASRMSIAPDHLSQQEHDLFTRMLKASLDAQEVLSEQGRWNNILILVVEKINDLPAFLYLNNPRSRSIYLERPDMTDRRRFIRSNFATFFRHGEAQEPSNEQINQFSDLTDGFSYYEMLSLVGLSQRDKIDLNHIRLLCERFKYGITESDWDKLDHQRLQQAGVLLRNRIKGQEPAVLRSLEIIKRAKLGLAAGSHSQRPRGVLFFAGPTGVGKTEMAKGLAELLFGQEERLIRFDMSEYSAQHADQKLMGAPPGYVGFEEGGELTNAIKQQPFSVLLFDEIEKAHANIFDKFLQILDDGRLTDGKGETVYFSECIIIFTSNLGIYGAPDGNGKRPQLVSTSSSYEEVQGIMLQAIRDHFNQVLGRPEILNRFGENFVVFDFIRPPVDEAIVSHLLHQLLCSLKEQQDIQLQFRKSIHQQLVVLARENLEFGGRGIRNIVDSGLINPLATALFDQQVPRGSRVIINGMRINESTEQQATTLDIAWQAQEKLQ